MRDPSDFHRLEMSDGSEPTMLTEMREELAYAVSEIDRLTPQQRSSLHDSSFSPDALRDLFVRVGLVLETTSSSVTLAARSAVAELEGLQTALRIAGRSGVADGLETDVVAPLRRALEEQTRSAGA